MNYSTKKKQFIYLLMGSNLGDAFSNLNKAIGEIEKYLGKIYALSSIYKTSPWGYTNQPDFYNQVAMAETELSPFELMEKIKSLEKNMGRSENRKWRERIIDIDILFFADQIIKSEMLTIPHPQLHNRKFTLIPLMEIAPELIHPVFKKSIKELLKICPDNGSVEPVNGKN